MEMASVKLTIYRDQLFIVYFYFLTAWMLVETDNIIFCG